MQRRCSRGMFLCERVVEGTVLVVQLREEGKVRLQMRSLESSCPMVLMSFSCVMGAVSIFLWIRYLLELRLLMRHSW